MSAIRTRELVREYRLGRENRVRALDGVDLDVETGEFVAVLGKSGSGKSTLLGVVGGLDRPTSGRLAVGGTELADLPERDLAAFRARTVGFVFQSFHLQPRYPAWENVALPLVVLGVGRRERRRRAEALLDEVGLAARVDHRPSELSGGEQQRVAFARSLVAEPLLLLADEPTGNLDSETSRQVVQLLVSAHERGTTLLLVTHDREMAQGTADRVIRMADGRIVESS